MATIIRGSHDEYVERLKAALDVYEHEHSNAVASLYRQGPGSVRIRVIDPTFAQLSKSRRHDSVWDFLSGRLDEDTIQEISILLLISPDEASSSFMNAEFNDPITSGL